MDSTVCVVYGGLLSEETGECPQCQQSVPAESHSVVLESIDRTEVLQRPHISQYDPAIFFFIEDNVLYHDAIASEKNVEQFNARLSSNDYAKFKSLILDNGEISLVKNYLVVTSGEGKTFRLEYSDPAVAEATFTELISQLDLEDKRSSREITGAEKFARAKGAMIFTAVWIACTIGMIPFFAYLATQESVRVPVIFIPFLKLGPFGCMVVFGIFAIIACLIAVRKLKQALYVEYVEI